MLGSWLSPESDAILWPSSDKKVTIIIIIIIIIRSVMVCYLLPLNTSLWWYRNAHIIIIITIINGLVGIVVGYASEVCPYGCIAVQMSLLLLLLLLLLGVRNPNGSVNFVTLFHYY